RATTLRPVLTLSTNERWPFQTTGYLITQPARVDDARKHQVPPDLPVNQSRRSALLLHGRTTDSRKEGGGKRPPDRMVHCPARVRVIPLAKCQGHNRCDACPGWV